MNYSIIPVHLAVKSMRDSGYRNAAYAIAELIDNSIQANATKVELLCAERNHMLTTNMVSRIEEIAILDNGDGMNADVLRMALQFGNGTHLQTEGQKGIGKFGMGLPSASISQAKRVDVWTWQEGIDKAFHSYLDVEDILNQTIKEVPEPALKPIPEIWKKISGNFDNKGTLVVWSKIDKCFWKTAKSIINNSEYVIGRMYRRFITVGKASIRLVGFNQETPTLAQIDRFSKPNDPLYLTSDTSCPAPYHDKPMFEKWGGDDYEDLFKIKHSGTEHLVKVRYSIAKKEARQDTRNAGSLPYGKHAAGNMGVSLMRADRELELDQSWVIGYDPRERWWGVEVDFPPALDDVFGVTNNKQFANNFSELGRLDIEEFLRNESKTIAQYKEELYADGDLKVYLLDIAMQVKKTINALRDQIKAQAANVRMTTSTRHENPTHMPEMAATQATEERMKEGYVGTSDKQGEERSDEDNKKELKIALEEEGVSKSDEEIEELWQSKYILQVSDLKQSAFFTVRPKGSKILITLDQSHPAYGKLVEVLDEPMEEATSDNLKERLVKASDGLKLLLMAWARYEDEQPDGKLKVQAQEARQDWGRIARRFLDKEE